MTKPTSVIAASLDTVFATVLPELLGHAGVRARRLLPGPVTVVVPNPGRRFRWLCGPEPSRIGLRVPVLGGVRSPRLSTGSVRSPERRRTCRASRIRAPRRGAGGDPLEGRGGDRRRADADRQALHGRRSDGPRSRGAARGRAVRGRDPCTPRRLLGGCRRASAAPIFDRLHVRAARIGVTVSITERTLSDLRTAGLAEIDPEIAELCNAELRRQREQLELIASENFTWPSVLEAVGSVSRTSTPRAFPVSATTAAARSSMRSSGSHRAGEVAVRRRARERPAALWRPRPTWPPYAVLSRATRCSGLRLDHGGHLTHGPPGQLLGPATTTSSRYGVGRDDERIDMDEVRATRRRSTVRS